MPDSDPTVGERILKQLKVLRIATAVLAVALVVGVIVVAVQQSKVSDALCTFKNDLVVRRAQSQKFLNDHPKGAFGFTRVQIQQGIDNYTRTIDSLSSLDCAPVDTSD